MLLRPQLSSAGSAQNNGGQVSTSSWKDIMDSSCKEKVDSEHGKNKYLIYQSI